MVSHDTLPKRSAFPTIDLTDNEILEQNSCLSTAIREYGTCCYYTSKRRIPEARSALNNVCTLYGKLHPWFRERFDAHAQDLIDMWGFTS